MALTLSDTGHFNMFLMASDMPVTVTARAMVREQYLPFTQDWIGHQESCFTKEL